MAGAGDYVYYQRTYERKIVDRVITALDATSTLANLLTVRNAFYELRIQKILFTPTTYTGATLTFQDTAATPVPIGVVTLPASAPNTAGQTSQYLIDLGPLGFPLTLGQSLSLIVTGVTPAGVLHIEGYQKLPYGAAVSLVNS
jgi:hypothetical protein